MAVVVDGLEAIRLVGGKRGIPIQGTGEEDHARPMVGEWMIMTRIGGAGNAPNQLVEVATMDRGQ